MTDITAEELSKINSFPRLVDLLRDKLDWPIPEDYGLEDVVFEYEPRELGLKDEDAAKLREIHQLRPLVTNQPWGIFFLSFEDKTMSVTVLRRILRALVVSKRGESKDAERAAWDKRDLIFAANFGKSGERELAFVHFNDGAATGDLPVMKVLGWNARDTVLHNRYAAGMLSRQLAWPDDPSDLTAWRNQWASAFSVGHREVITTAQELAKRLAALAGDIRARVNQLLDAETETGPMRVMLKAFQKNLIHDLDDDGFADMFAQTICYGLLAASISSVDDEGRSVIVADRLENMVPRTNPFLKELFSNFLHLGGRDKTSALDFDELGVRDVVDMLNQAKMGRVLEDFGNRNPKKDPVIHFYEDFLREYDRDQKVDAGIFYTPPAVVGFIVRGVDEMLRTEFDLPLGLADTMTWGELAARNEKISVPDHIDPELPFVQILDPATGTGTFVVEVIDLIHKRMVETWKAQGKSPGQIKAAWNDYVPQYLLPRITAFELKMAAYSIAHMKIGLKLVETGYTFGSDERAHILLTNSLQPPRDLDLDERARQVAFAHEAERANEAKQCGHFTVVVGNPPYKGHSMNPSKVNGKLTFAGEIIQRFFQVRGTPLGEKNPKWLNNDYVKFIAFAMTQIERSGAGVMGYITSNSWLDSPTFRGVRTQVIDCFPLLRIVDLHGHIKKREVASDGSRDEGVFAIEEGTAIAIAARLQIESNVSQIDLVGKVGDGQPGSGKLNWLDTSSLTKVTNTITPQPPFFIIGGSDQSLLKEYFTFRSLSDALPLRNLGYQTHRDAFATDWKREDLEERLDSAAKTSEENLPEGISYEIFKKLQSEKFLSEAKRSIRLTAYRPFDDRYCIMHDAINDRSRSGFVASIETALILNVSRQQSSVGFRHALVSEREAESCLVSNKTREGNYTIPIWLKPGPGEPHRRPNIDRTWAMSFGEVIQLAYHDGIQRGQQGNLGEDFVQPKAEQIGLLDQPWDGRGDLAKTFGPRDLFEYIYAVLHAPSYRSRYAEFLKSDFPRIPTPGSSALFVNLVPLGRELVALHLLKFDEAPALNSPEIRFCGSGEARVAKGYPEYENGKVKINASRWFEDVPRATYEFHVGGYQPCEKWLKDRAAKGGKNPSEGRVLTEDDILHYRRMVTALTETRRIMAEIDNVIETHGGWPGAFKVEGEEK
jgi:hypothetical protein